MTRKFRQYFLLTLVLLKSFCFFSQNKLHDKTVVPDKLVDNELYSFMQVITADLQLNKSFGLSSTPDTSFQYQKIDRDFLSKYLIDTIYLKSKHVFDSTQHNMPLDSPILINPDVGDSRKCLTKGDVASMLKKKKITPSFKWQKSKFGFSSTNKKDWYSFSLPIFNEDNSKAIILIRHTCAGFLCGDGAIYVFLKVDNKWDYVVLVYWNN